MKAILTLVATAVAAVALAAPAISADRFIPGVTDFPSAEREQRYVPGVTDFPRSGPIEPAATVLAGDRFDWLDAGFGIAVGVALGASSAALLLVLRRRTGVSAAA